MDVEALDDFHLEAVSIDLILDHVDLIHGPNIARGDLCKMSCNPADAGYLSDLIQLYAVISVWEPSQNQFHMYSNPRSNL